MSSVYSFGEDSPMKFELPDKKAELYNQAAQAWFDAQRKFNKTFGRPWNPEMDHITVSWSRRQRKAWNEVSKAITKVMKEQGPFHENDFMDDFLVKNAGAAVASGVGNFAAAISVAVTFGVAYGLLRGRKLYS